MMPLRLKVVVAAALGVLLLVTTVVAINTWGAPSQNGSPDTSNPKPDSLKDFTFILVTEDGEKQSRLSEIIGKGKPVLLEITYIGCGSCEMLHSLGYLRDVYSNYKDKVEILSLFIYNEGQEKILKYRDSFGLNWKYYGYLKEGAADFLINYQIKGLFAHIFFDEQGVERYRNYARIEFVKESYPRIFDLLFAKQYDQIIKEFGEPIDVIEAG